MVLKTYKVTLPKNIPAQKFWSLTLYDNQTRSMLDTPQRYPRAGSQSYAHCIVACVERVELRLRWSDAFRWHTAF